LRSAAGQSESGGQEFRQYLAESQLADRAQLGHDGLQHQGVGPQRKEVGRLPGWLDKDIRPGWHNNVLMLLQGTPGAIRYADPAASRCPYQESCIVTGQLRVETYLSDIQEYPAIRAHRRLLDRRPMCAHIRIHRRSPGMTNSSPAQELTRHADHKCLKM
jgi:hypothetical protein